ncbi:DMT family transporter [Aestuariivirga litoralis]|uniref:DMT family transporter n=1 Tax=Aestuariivirga litoralis TaxID=2650924 RepID=UPI0018C7A348|nr:DMT family transporter [Aestuariivirga litoralis]MBG1232817.1 EamA family transporter [Aestuariivirga litoralis]
MTSHTKGLITVAVSALLFSTPGLFTRSVSVSGWDVIFWRGVFGVIFTVAFMARRGKLQGQIFNLGWPGWINAFFWASGTIAYIQAYKLTSIANVSLIYGVAPMLTALVAWLWFREWPRTIVMAASVLALAGVAIIGAGSFGTVHIAGDLLAFWMTCTVAIGLSTFRRYPDIPAAGVTVMSSLLVLPPCLIWGDPFNTPLPEIGILAVFGLVFALAAILLNEGSKLLPVSEAALMSNLEVPVQPLLAWLAFAEWPSRAAFIGGALILIAIIASSWPQRQKVAPA